MIALVLLSALLSTAIAQYMGLGYGGYGGYGMIPYMYNGMGGMGGMGGMNGMAGMGGMGGGYGGYGMMGQQYGGMMMPGMMYSIDGTNLLNTAAVQTSGPNYGLGYGTGGTVSNGVINGGNSYGVKNAYGRRYSQHGAPTKQSQSQQSSFNPLSPLTAPLAPLSQSLNPLASLLNPTANTLLAPGGAFMGSPGCFGASCFGPQNNNNFGLPFGWGKKAAAAKS